MNYDKGNQYRTHVASDRPLILSELSCAPRLQVELLLVNHLGVLVPRDINDHGPGVNDLLDHGIAVESQFGLGKVCVVAEGDLFQFDRDYGSKEKRDKLRTLGRN